MKKILLVLLVFAGFNCSAQGWKKYQFDENLAVQVPTKFEVFDTLGQHFIRAVIDHGIIVVQRMADRRRSLGEKFQKRKKPDQLS
jgi:hypothetical protein